MDGAIAVATAPKSTGVAKLKSVSTPSPDVIRDALMKTPGGKLPEITFDVDHTDASGRELEWSWNFNNGIWHPYTSASPLVISDRAFAWQGKFDIGLQSRVKGDIHTVSDVIHTSVIVDSVGPRILADKAAWTDGKFAVPVWDITSGKDVQVAYGRPGIEQPLTAWIFQGDAGLDQKTFNELKVNGEVVVYARDEAGNTSQALVGFHGQSGATGCACQTTSGGPSLGGLALFGIVGLMLRRRRRPFSQRAKRIAARAAMYTAITIAISVMPACDCNNKGQSCETADDCTMCPEWSDSVLPRQHVRVLG